MSDSSRPHLLQSTRLLCPWDFPGKNTGVGCHCLLRDPSPVVFKYFFSSWIFFSKWNLNVKPQCLKGKNQTSSEWSGHRSLGHQQLHLPFSLPPLPHSSSLEKVWETIAYHTIAYPWKRLSCLCHDASSELSPKADMYCNKHNNNFLQGRREVVASHHLPTSPQAPHLFLLEEKIHKLNWKPEDWFITSSTKFCLKVLTPFLIYLAVPVLSWSMWDIVPQPGIEPRPLCTGSLEF